MKVQHVSKENIYSVWGEARASLARSTAMADDEHTPEDLLDDLLNDRQRLYVIMEEKPVGWMTVKVASFPRKKLLVVTHIGGKGVAKEEGFKQLQDIAKSYGCSQIQIFCKEAQARLWRQALKFKDTYRVMRFDI